MQNIMESNPNFIFITVPRWEDLSSQKKRRGRGKKKKTSSSKCNKTSKTSQNKLLASKNIWEERVDVYLGGEGL